MLLPQISLPGILSEIADEKTVEKVALAIIADLKDRCEIAGVPGVPGGREESSVTIGLGKSDLDLGFLTEPVVQFLLKRFRENANHSSTGSSSYESAGMKVSRNTFMFSTNEGDFWLEHTHSWFVRRKVG